MADITRSATKVLGMAVVIFLKPKMITMVPNAKSNSIQLIPAKAKGRAFIDPITPEAYFEAKTWASC
ncbi:MAG: Uncharacterised protein [Flavobacteriaceae bacterium]|nr:MAG: Uncharacterised protein [Flavobacteriaceae bacterium]